MSAAQRRAVLIVLDELSIQADVLGIVLAGSVLRGESGPTSDLDIYTVVSSPLRRRRYKLIDGVRVELYSNPPWTIRAYLEEERADGTPMTAHMLATGIVLYAVGDVLPVLCAEAQAALRQGPPCLSEDALKWRVYEVVDVAEDAEDVCGVDHDALALLVPVLVQRAVDLLYARAGRWRPKLKRLPADLERLDPAAGALLRTYLRETDLLRRHTQARALAERAIVPYPLRFFAWDGAPEQAPQSAD